MTRTIKKLFLVDGNSYLYRAFYATPYLSNSKGIPTNATFAFISMLKKLLKEEKPDSLVVVFDSKVPSFREEISKEYKAQRPPMPDNLSIQIPYVKKIVKAMGIPILEKERFEADDIIGTIVHKLKNEPINIYIITSDKDMMQCVGERTIIFDTMKNMLIGEKEVIERFGIKPHLIVDYLALCGDTSDNIPGVPGIGEKTARELVSTMGTIEMIYENLDKIKKPAVKEKLIKNKDFAFMSKELARIHTNVPIDTNLDSLSIKEEDTQELRGLFRELEFTSLYKELKTDEVAHKTYHEKPLSNMGTENIAIAVTYHGTHPIDIEAESFAVFDGDGTYYSTNGEELYTVLMKTGSITTHNLKELLLCIKHMNPDYVSDGTHHFFDTMLASYLLNPLRKDYSLENLIEEYLQRTITTNDKKKLLIQKTLHLFELRETLDEQMKACNLRSLFFDVEIPLIPVLADMEFYGVKVDRKILTSLSRDLDQRLNTLVREIHARGGEPFNINSPQQLSRILFEKLKLPPVKKTKTGYSTDTEVLQTLSSLHELPGKILEYRTLTKLKGTYIDVLPTLINHKTGRIHASFNQMVVATGRLSSSDPNLQNIPIRGEEGKKIREAFVPEAGYVLMSSDYSQIELRVLAHISRDPILIDTFMKDEDIHSKVAQEIFKVEEQNVTPEMRRTAKVINFGIVYGMSSYGLAKELGISQKEAQQYIDDYFERHRGVKEYIEKALEEAHRNGFVKTLLGRIRYIPELSNPDTNIRQLGERAAINTPIQGTAADIIKIAMVNIHRRITKEKLSSRLIMQIHDELVFEVKKEELTIMKPLVIYEMEHAMNLIVPLKVSIGYGESWAQAHD
jgi:DNA polymerase-1